MIPLPSHLARLPRIFALLLAVLWLAPLTAGAAAPRNIIAPTGVSTGGFGLSASSAGDFNGDGYVDFIVGEPLTDIVLPDAGRAHLYYGGPNADDVADLVFTWLVSYARFGMAVGAAGDVNGDGYDDVIVGADAVGIGGDGIGHAYIFYGGAAPNTAADLTLTGAVSGDRFGSAADGAGDVNNDGFADLIVGANGSGTSGRAYVFLGGASPNSVADMTLTGESGGDDLGSAVGAAGDFNGDGFGDVIVGAPHNDAGGSGAGRAYVYYGGAAPNSVADVTFTGTLGQSLGNDVGTAGDMNGDARSDVIVGLPDANEGGANVYYGGNFPDVFADIAFLGNISGDRFGVAASAAGDVNGDGYPDLIVGASEVNGIGLNTGEASVFYGGPGVDLVPDLVVTGLAMNAFLGSVVGTAGDFNADGYADFIVASNQAAQAMVVTARTYDLVSPNGGEMWVAGQPATVRWRGPALADIAVSYDAGATWNTVTSGVGGARDNSFSVLAPGTSTDFARVRVAATGEAVSNLNSDMSNGAFRIVTPAIPPRAAARLQFTLFGQAVGDNFGQWVSGIGDMNGDGYADIAAGSGYSDIGTADGGVAKVYFGGPAADSTADLELAGPSPGDAMGIVSGAGDLNADGFADLIVGAPGGDYTGANAGVAWVFYGGATPNSLSDVSLDDGLAGDGFGEAVSGAGDVNGDGNSDVIVGAASNDAAGVDAGRAYVYFGGLDSDPDMTLTGEAAGDHLGVSVSGAGDVNGDGFADVIVGADGNDAAGSLAGRAYLYLGGAAPNSVADITFTGEAALDVFGRSVRGAGDVNGDGYADVVVGAFGSDAGGVTAGRAYVYFGGPVMDSVADLVLTGSAANELFGTSVSRAGDVNGDDYDDLIVGAQNGVFAGSNLGRAYLYYGGPGMDAVADYVFTGPGAGDVASVVAGAGDINGDGHDDLLVGAPLNKIVATGAGAVYVLDMNRYHLLSPNCCDTWNVGAQRDISWLGAEPADVWLSSDGGETYEPLDTRVGGSASNTISIRVPHTPTKFARVKLTPSDAAFAGSDRSDSLFTIQTSIALLALLAAPLPERAGVAVISWRSDPGPEDLAGYRLEKASGSSAWRTIMPLTRETSYTDEAAGMGGARYRLFAVNGFGDELLLGETSLRLLAPLAAWPVPYRGGDLSVSFATHGGLGGGAGSAEVLLYDVRGRLVRTIARGDYPAGHQSATWNGRDGRGRAVAAGVYFLQSRSAGQEKTMKLIVLR